MLRASIMRVLTFPLMGALQECAIPTTFSMLRVLCTHMHARLLHHCSTASMPSKYCTGKLFGGHVERGQGVRTSLVDTTFALIPVSSNTPE